ncbi:hypothetical protein [Hymenobacter volaticus]|nr:hypothetical protein [Hymenobacter volaticus]
MTRLGMVELAGGNFAAGHYTRPPGACAGTAVAIAGEELAG